MSAHGNEQKAIVFEEELRHMNQWIGASPDRETGGDLFGLWTHSGWPVVHYTIGPGPRANGTPTFFNQDRDFLVRAGRLLINRWGLQHIGQWHSHHHMELDHPSAHDTETVVQAIHQYGIPRFFLVIANLVGHPGAEARPKAKLNGFLYRSAADLDLWQKERDPAVSPQWQPPVPQPQNPPAHPAPSEHDAPAPQTAKRDPLPRDGAAPLYASGQPMLTRWIVLPGASPFRPAIDSELPTDMAAHAQAPMHPADDLPDVERTSFQSEPASPPSRPVFQRGTWISTPEGKEQLRAIARSLEHSFGRIQIRITDDETVKMVLEESGGRHTITFPDDFPASLPQVTSRLLEHGDTFSSELDRQISREIAYLCREIGNLP